MTYRSENKLDVTTGFHAVGFVHHTDEAENLDEHSRKPLKKLDSLSETTALRLKIAHNLSIWQVELSLASHPSILSIISHLQIALLQYVFDMRPGCRVFRMMAFSGNIAW
jgi:hypothetical protein